MVKIFRWWWWGHFHSKKPCYTNFRLDYVELRLGCNNTLVGRQIEVLVLVRVMVWSLTRVPANKELLAGRFWPIRNY